MTGDVRQSRSYVTPHLFVCQSAKASLFGGAWFHAPAVRCAVGPDGARRGRHRRPRSRQSGRIGPKHAHATSKGCSVVATGAQGACRVAAPGCAKMFGFASRQPLPGFDCQILPVARCHVQGPFFKHTCCCIQSLLVLVSVKLPCTSPSWSTPVVPRLYPGHTPGHTLVIPWS